MDRVNMLAERVRDLDRAHARSMYTARRRAIERIRIGVLTLLEMEREAATPGAERDRVADVIATLTRGGGR